MSVVVAAACVDTVVAAACDDTVVAAACDDTVVVVACDVTVDAVGEVVVAVPSCLVPVAAAVAGYEGGTAAAACHVTLVADFEIAVAAVDLPL